ncbi:MAG: hypothetical protein CM1200mP28_01380 [Deltaproteobacteria bacterium]|nr:MAG: hypothetical protein CM1200mP28_01380 [Deltaproteobacteria bacterium]
MSPRMAWRAIMEVLPKEAIISSDIGNNCAIGKHIQLLSRDASIWPRGYLVRGYGFPL